MTTPHLFGGRGAESAQWSLRREASPPPPPRKGSKTQADQDKEDEKERHKALQNLVQSWQDRLQLIALITTFFAAAEINFLVITTTPSDNTDPIPPIREATNACFNGALVFHAFSATVSFLAAFVLIGYKLKEAKQEEKETDEAKLAKQNGTAPPKQAPPATPAKQEEGKARPSLSAPPDEGSRRHSGESLMPAIWSSDPHMVYTYFRGVSTPPVHLLQRLHALCTMTAIVGFILAFVGIISFAWAWHTRSVGIFASSCLAACVISTVIFVNTGSAVINDD